MGKVVLEKILRSLPNIKKLFVMVRDKKGMSVRQRFDNGILSSEIFREHFKLDPNFQETIRDKVIPVAGDLIIDRLGLS